MNTQIEVITEASFSFENAVVTEPRPDLFIGSEMNVGIIAAQTQLASATGHNFRPAMEQFFQAVQTNYPKTYLELGEKFLTLPTVDSSRFDAAEQLFLRLLTSLSAHHSAAFDLAEFDSATSSTTKPGTVNASQSENSFWERKSRYIASRISEQVNNLINPEQLLPTIHSLIMNLNFASPYWDYYLIFIQNVENYSMLGDPQEPLYQGEPQLELTTYSQFVNAGRHMLFKRLFNIGIYSQKIPS